MLVPVFLALGWPQQHHMLLAVSLLAALASRLSSALSCSVGTRRRTSDATVAPFTGCTRAIRASAREPVGGPYSTVCRDCRYAALMLAPDASGWSTWSSDALAASLLVSPEARSAAPYRSLERARRDWAGVAFRATRRVRPAASPLQTWTFPPSPPRRPVACRRLSYCRRPLPAGRRPPTAGGSPRSTRTTLIPYGDLGERTAPLARAGRTDVRRFDPDAAAPPRELGRDAGVPLRPPADDRRYTVERRRYRCRRRLRWTTADARGACLAYPVGCTGEDVPSATAPPSAAAVIAAATLVCSLSSWVSMIPLSPPSSSAAVRPLLRTTHMTQQQPPASPQTLALPQSSPYYAGLSCPRSAMGMTLFSSAPGRDRKSVV